MSKTKTEPKEGMISSPEPKKNTAKKKPSQVTLSDDIIGSNISTEQQNTTAPGTKKRLTVAIHSTKNVNWEGVGKVKKGYNIVKKAEADKWLTRGHIRLATPEEIAIEYGV